MCFMIYFCCTVGSRRSQEAGQKRTLAKNRSHVRPPVGIRQARPVIEV